MDKINLSLGNQQALALSESRIKNFLDGNNVAAQKMGWFDTFKDQLFHGGAKQEALQQLAQEFDAAHGLSAFEKFERLSRYAAPADRSQFTIIASGDADTPVISYQIKGHVVKQDDTSAETREVIAARMGFVIDLDEDMATPHAAHWLAQHERDDLEDARASVVDGDFDGEGGVHKRFDPTSGVLRAEDATGAADFQREKLVEQRAEASDSLARYVSTQKAIARDDMWEQLPSIHSDKPHATVTLYDQTHVTSGELDRQLDTLSAREARSVLMQVVDMARVFYQNDISHQDLHMHNLMVHKPVDAQQNNITLKAIDFGKSRVDVHTEADRLNDVRYLFHKQASSGTLETMRRNARETFNYDMDKQAKHYPLHKLLVQCAQASPGQHTGVAADAFDESISTIGNRLVTQLQQAETLVGDARTDAIDAAFNQAMTALAAISDGFDRLDMQAHFVRA